MFVKYLTFNISYRKVANKLPFVYKKNKIPTSSCSISINNIVYSLATTGKDNRQVNPGPVQWKQIQLIKQIYCFL